MKQLSLFPDSEPEPAEVPPEAVEIPLPGSLLPDSAERSVGRDLAAFPGNELPPGVASWEAWLARDHTPENRLDDILFQIRRDVWALKSEAGLDGELVTFLQGRLERYRSKAKELMA